MEDHHLAIALTTSKRPEESLVGGKAASLIQLTQAGLSVPDGFVLTTTFFAPWVNAVKSSSEWQVVCAQLDSSSPSELRELCDRVKHLAVNFPFTEPQRIHLGEISTALAHCQLAVRSSSPEEDLSGASFAGLYKTVLNTPPNMLEPAVRSCFVSCLDERVLTYKRVHGYQVEAPSIAVIIQMQIASEVSGVAFSLNPLTNDFDQAVVNATWGLGEALVSGGISPDTAVIDKVTGKIVEHRTGTKGGQRSKEFCLSEQQLSELTETLKVIEELYTVPVDVEWSFAGRHLYVLQARPITAYVPLAPEMLTAPQEPRLLYLDSALSKGLTIDSAITPMTSDVYLHLIRSIVKAVLGWRDIRLDPKSTLGGLAGARVYVNLSHLLYLMSVKLLINRARMTDAMIAETLETQSLERYRTQEPPPFLRILPRWFTRLKILWGFRDVVLSMLASVMRRERFSERFRAEVRSFEQVMAEPPNFRLPLDEFVYGYYAKWLTVFRNATGPGLIFFIFFGTKRVETLINGTSKVQRDLVDAIKRGYSGDLVVEMGTFLYRLSTILPPSEYTDIGLLAQKLSQRKLPEAFLSTWDEFIRRFGCRGPMEMELANPKYGDDPLIALRQIATIARSGGACNPEAIHQRHVHEREVAYCTLSAQLTGCKRWKFERSYRNIVEFGGTRDTPKHHLMMINKLIRERLLVEADVLIAGGRLDRREQIFELTLDDLKEAAQDLKLDLRARVRERGRVYRKVKATVKHFPQMIDSRGRIIRPKKLAVAGELSGTAVSPGVVRGPVKVLDDPFEKEVMPGDVVVAYATDPGWTPLFITAAAVVLEVGGELQHGALVAREYGKPCVAGIDQVTTHLHDGDIVEVDGYSGAVRIIVSADPVGIS